MTTTSIRLLGVSLRDLHGSAGDVLPLAPTEVEDLLHSFSQRFPEAGLVILSTCVRLEFYIDGAGVQGEMLHEVMSDLYETERCPVLDLIGYELEEEEAAGHLFRVATGLESPILGDNQVLAQLRRAEESARSAGCFSRRLSELMRQARKVGKQVRRETTIASGGADVGTAVARAALSHLADLDEARVLVVGAGDAAGSVVDALIRVGVERVDVANRSLESARALAGRGSGSPLGLTDLAVNMTKADLIVSATAPGVQVISDEHLERVGRHQTPPLLMDLVPGGSIPAGEGISTITVADIEDWSDPIRLAAVDETETVCSTAVVDWKRWCASRPIEAIVADLYERVDPMVDQLVNLLASSTDDPSGAIAARRAVKTWLHPHVERLRSLPETSAPESRPAVTENPICVH